MGDLKKGNLKLSVGLLSTSMKEIDLELSHKGMMKESQE